MHWPSNSIALAKALVALEDPDGYIHQSRTTCKAGLLDLTCEVFTDIVSPHIVLRFWDLADLDRGRAPFGDVRFGAHYRAALNLLALSDGNRPPVATSRATTSQTPRGPASQCIAPINVFCILYASNKCRQMVRSHLKNKKRVQH